MKEKNIKVFYGTNTKGTVTTLNKIDAMKLISELLETKEVETIEINIKN